MCVDEGMHSVKNMPKFSVPAVGKTLQPQHLGGGEYTIKGSTELFKTRIGTGHASLFKERC